MGTFSETVVIHAPREAVWRALADIASIHEWNPGVQASSLTSDQAEGVGASRVCDLGRAGDLHEEVAMWEPPRRLTLRITQTDLPFARGDIAFTIREEAEGTAVTVAPDYALKYGPLGSLLDALMVRRTYRKGMRDLLVGLKAHVEGA